MSEKIKKIKFNDKLFNFSDEENSPYYRNSNQNPFSGQVGNDSVNSMNRNTLNDYRNQYNENKINSENSCTPSNNDIKNNDIENINAQPFSQTFSHNRNNITPFGPGSNISNQNQINQNLNNTNINNNINNINDQSPFSQSFNNVRNNITPFNSALSQNNQKEKKNVKFDDINSFNPNSLETGKDLNCNNNNNENINENKNEIEKPRISRIEPEDVNKINKIVRMNTIDDIPKLHKKLDFKLPVKFKSIEHFKLHAIIIKLMANAKKDMETHCEDKALESLNLAKYYMTKIEH